VSRRAVASATLLPLLVLLLCPTLRRGRVPRGWREAMPAASGRRRLDRLARLCWLRLKR
jgi:hypothetical protein